MRRLCSLLTTLRLTLLLVLFSGIQGTAIPASAQSLPPPNANPNYFFDRETAFAINYVMDYGSFGGIFTAVDKFGVPHGRIDTNVWGIKPDNPLFGTDKSLYGQAVCIRYFVGEYQRVRADPTHLDDINALLNPNRGPITADDLLGFAHSCADFVINNMVIEDAPEPCTFTVDVYRNVTWRGRTPYRCDVLQPGYVFYWSSMNRDRTDRFIDDTNPDYMAGADRAESSVPWSIAELALTLKESGYPASVWSRYSNHARAWAEWQVLQPDPPPYNGNQINNFGVARDLFLAPLLSTLYLVTGDISYRQRAEDYLNTYLGTGDRMPTSLQYAIRDGTYTAGLARGVVFAHHAQRYGNTDLSDRDQWWDFGNWPLARAGVPYFDPYTQPAFTPENLAVPFAHFRGRELVAGVLRSWWLFHTFGANPRTSYGPAMDFLQVQQATVDHWTYVNSILWDDDAGYASWLESLSQTVYKPCFSAGTEGPIADWRPPIIGDKVHTVNADNSAAITISGVRDADWPYLSLNLRGGGIASVEIVYTFDAGQSWQRIPAQPVDGQTWVGTIPPAPPDTQVWYYVVARDNFANNTAFPDGAEVWADDGTSILQDISRAQSYNEQPQTSTPAPETPTETPTGTLSITPTFTPTVTGTLSATPTGTLSVTPPPGTTPGTIPPTPQTEIRITQTPGRIPVSGGELDISKRTAQAFLLPGQFIDWIITLRNPGSSPLTDIVLTDSLPVQLEAISSDSNLGTASISGQDVTISIPVLDAGASARWTIRSRLRPGAVPSAAITNSIGGASATILMVTGLPVTGETPWWRPWLIGGALLGSAAVGLYLLRR